VTEDNELRELRDTLAIEITREMVRRQFETDTPLDGALAGLLQVYPMVDSVLSGRGTKLSITEAQRQAKEPISVLPQDPRLPPGMQQAADEAFVRGNWPGEIRVTVIGPNCEERDRPLVGYTEILLGGRSDDGGVNIQYEANLRWCVRSADDADAWASARRMIEERWEKGAPK